MMQVWLAVVKKEIRLGWPLFLFGLGGFVIAALLATLTTEYAPIDLVEGISFLFYILLVSFFPLYMIGSLSKEDRRFATWMQIPLPGWALISAKLASGVLYTVALAWMTWITTRLLVPRGIERFEGKGISADRLQFLRDVKAELLPTLTTFLYMAILIASVATAVAVLMHTLKSKIRFGRSLIGILIFCAFSFGMAWLSETEVYRRLFDWGHLTTLGSVMDYEPVYAGGTLVELVSLILVVWGAGKLLDRKAGV